LPDKVELGRRFHSGRQSRLWSVSQRRGISRAQVIVLSRVSGPVAFLAQFSISGWWRHDDYRPRCGRSL